MHRRGTTRVWLLSWLLGLLWLLAACVAPDGTVYRLQTAPDGSVTGWQVDQPADGQAAQQTDQGEMTAEEYHNSGNAYFDQQAWAQAVEEYSKAIALEANRLEPYFFRGLAHAFQGEWERAIEDFDQVIVLAPDLFDAYYYRGLVHMNQEMWEQANEDFEQLLRLRPDDAQVHNFLCWSYGLQGQPETALPYCNQAIELVPDPNFFDSRGLVHAQLNDFDAAIADFQVAIEALEDAGDADSLSMLEERKAWVEALQASTNPVTPEVLAEKLEELWQSAGF